MTVKYMKKGKWYQVGGDIDAATYGAVLARWDGLGIEFMHIDPVPECIDMKYVCEIGHPFWVSFGYRDGEKTKPTLSKAIDFAHAESISESIVYEECQAVWGKEVVRHLGGSVSRVNWFRKQGHGFRSADAEFRYRLKNEGFTVIDW